MLFERSIGIRITNEVEKRFIEIIIPVKIFYLNRIINMEKFYPRIKYYYLKDEIVRY